MRKVILSLVILTCAAAAPAQTGITPLPKEKLEGVPVLSLPETVVRDLYRAHRNGHGHVFERQGRKLQQRFFDQKLAALIWKDVTRPNQDEVGNLDFDPLYNAQDTQIKSFRVGAGTVKGLTATVPVTFMNYDQRVRLDFRLVNTQAGWKIANIDYGQGSDLVQILSQPL